MSSILHYYRDQEQAAVDREDYEAAAKWRDKARAAEQHQRTKESAGEVKATEEKDACRPPGASLTIHRPPPAGPLAQAASTPAPTPTRHPGEWHWIMEKAMRAALNEGMGRDVSDSEIRREGFTVTDLRTGVVNYFFRGKPFFMLNLNTGEFAPIAGDEDQ